MKKMISLLLAGALLPLFGGVIPPGKMEVERTEENKIKVTSDFSEKYQLLRTAGDGIKNKQFNFEPVYLIDKKTKKSFHLHRCTDDTTPWNMYGTYIGANHGCSDGNTLKIKNHGFTRKDLGKKILTEKGKDFYIMEIINKDTFGVFSLPNKHKTRPWAFSRIAFKRGPLNVIIDGKKIQAQNMGIYQLTPCIRFLSRSYLADGKELKKGEKRICSTFVVKDSHIVLQPDTMVLHQVKNPGKMIDLNDPSLEMIVRNDITYTFTADGNCIVDSRSELMEDLYISLFGGLQSQIPGNGYYFPSHIYYVPKTRPLKAVFKGKIRGKNVTKNFSLDFVKGVNFAQYPFPSVFFGPDYSNITDPASYPDTCIQFFGQKDKKRQAGYALGFSMTQGATRKGVWQKYSRKPIWINYTRKTYPFVIANKQMKKGEKFHFYGYRQYFDAAKAGIPGSFYSHKLNQYKYYYYDSHENTPDFLLKEKLAGKMEIVEASKGLTAKQTKEGVKIKGSSPYARLVFRVKVK